MEERMASQQRTHFSIELVEW